MEKGKTIFSGEDAPIEASNRMPLSRIPVGTQIYGIEIHPGKGAQMVRSAGTKAQLMAKEGDYAQVRLPSGEVRRFRQEATAAIGVVGNVQHQNIKIGSAGRNRRKGIRPGVRGVVMNAAAMGRPRRFQKKTANILVEVTGDIKPVKTPIKKAESAKPTDEKEKK